MQFFKNLLANLIALIIFSVVVIVGSLYLIFSGVEDIEVKKNSVLKISINKTLLDRPNSSDINLMTPVSQDVGLFSIQKAIKASKNDPLIKAIYLEIDELNGSMANVSSLKRTIEDFKKSGKSVIAFSEGLSQIGYYLACSSDSIFVNHLSSVEWKGLGAKIIHFKSMLDKIGVKAEPIRIGKFKSAIEPFISDSISSENFNQVNELLIDIWSNLLKEVSVTRGKSKNELIEIANDYGYLMAREALKFGLIDGVKYEDEVLKAINSLVGDKTNYISVENYNKAKEGAFDIKNKVVVVNADGAISDGNSEKGVSGIKYGKILDDVLKDKFVKALVLRVNSPGGSALASEKLWRKLKLIQNKIPVIVSMGNVAASGGYYIASAGDFILAESNTITGSIGVFGLMFNTKELVNNLGVTIEKVNTNEMSDFPSFDRELKNKERSRMKKGVMAIYKTFLARVKSSRKMSEDDVQKLAQGRVWSGNEARENGLVDSIGGLSDAISIAVERANLEKYCVIHLPENLSPIEAVVKQFSKRQSICLPEPFTQYSYMLQNPSFFKALSKPQMRLPFVLEIN